MASNYVPTGYPRGRPRFGEARPPSPNSIKWQTWRRKKVAKDPKYKEVLAKRQSDWRFSNLNRSNEIGRQSYARKRLWREHFS